MIVLFGILLVSFAIGIMFDSGTTADKCCCVAGFAICTMALLFITHMI
jgi:hypothetical protein